MAPKAATKSATQKKASPRRPKGGVTAKQKGKGQRGPLHALRLTSVTADRVIDFLGILLAFGGLLTALAMLPSDQPSLAQPWLELLARLFGTLAVAAPLGMIAVGAWLVARRFENAPSPPWYRLFGVVLFLVSLLGALGLTQMLRAAEAAPGYGGLVGLGIARGVTLAIGRIGGGVALLFTGLLGLLFLFELSLADIGRALARLRPAPKPVVNQWADPSPPPAERAIQLPLPSVPELVERGHKLWLQVQHRLAERASTPTPEPALVAKAASPAPAPAAAPGQSSAPPAESPQWQLPPWQTLLEDRVDLSSTDEDIRHKTHVIEETLKQFGVPARVVEINRGPTVTQYGVEPGFVQRRVRGEERELKVKVSAITNLHNDLALALAAQSIRIEAPVPGQSYVGIEVPNDQAAAVTLYGTMDSEEFRTLRGGLRVALGRDVMGNALVADMTRMPHLLIAGATGSGKSVCINTIISSLICHNSPDQLKLLMVDPKMVELIPYNGIPHLIVPVVTEIDRVVGLLRWTVNEMERRYKIFSESRVRNLEAYNETIVKRGERPLPYLVLIIDELADLMMVAADQVEAMICRLAQMARATGIHLILATQRPSVDVVTGLIKANFPARIAFAVTSQVDSRVILDRPGAEALLGRGDMLYMASDSGALKRAQGCFVSDREIEEINRHWIRQVEQRQSQPVPTGQRSEGAQPVPPVQAVLWDELLEEESQEEDELLPKAREIVAKAGSASISMLQRRLRVGYARAARIVDLLEAEGTIGNSEGPGKTREVFTDSPEPGSDDDPGYDPAWVNEG